MNIQHHTLKKLVGSIFSAAGSQETEADQIAASLVDSNLVGHDSHGVIRVPAYIRWVKEGKVLPNKQPQVVFENDVIAVVDGQEGFGQVMGRHVMKLGLEKCENQGVAVIALRNSAHVGRVGEWAGVAARAGKVSLHFVNTNGLGMLVAPLGGVERRLSANPVAVGIPVPGREPIVLDISTCAIAEGKIKVALNKGESVPDNCILDNEGQPTNDPKVFYGPPAGSILSMAAHKGYGLGIITDVLAGALTGGGCSGPGRDSLSQGMLTVIFDPETFQQGDFFGGEMVRFVDWIKSSRKTSPDGEILVPGDIEEKYRADRTKNGIELDKTTWGQLLETCDAVGISRERVDELVADG